VYYSKLVKKWASYARLDPRKYSTHSLRRTKSSVVYARTGNLEVCRQILGHHSIANTALSYSQNIRTRASTGDYRFEHHPRFGLSSTQFSPMLSVQRDGKG